MRVLLVLTVSLFLGGCVTLGTAISLGSSAYRGSKVVCQYVASPEQILALDPSALNDQAYKVALYCASLRKR